MPVIYGQRRDWRRDLGGWIATSAVAGHPAGAMSLREHGARGESSSIARSAAIEDQRRTAFVDGEALAASRILAFNWRLLASITGVLVAALIASEFYIDPSGYTVAFGAATLYWWIGRCNALSMARANPKVFLCLGGLAQLVLAVPVMLTLSYLATSIDFPLRDAALLSWDRALGFDFKALLDFTDRHRELIPLLARSYNSLNQQMLVAVLILPLAGCYRRSAEAVCAFLLALLATTCISTMVPAFGVYDTLGLKPSADFPHIEPLAYYDSFRDLPLVRGGYLHKLSLTSLVGLLTFPSFHAASAALFMWTFWPLRWLRFVAIAWNILMLVSTPLDGGHYFVDVLAGISVAIAAILVTLWISAACSPKAAAVGPAA